MNTETYGCKGTARIVGILYIIGTVAGVLSVRFLNVRNEPEYLSRIAEDTNALVAGAILTLVMGIALALIPVFIFRILKTFSVAAGVGYVVFRGALETCTYIISAVCYLALSALGAAYASGAQDAANLLSAGATLNAIADSSVTVFFFTAGALIFYTALYKYKLVPRWISGIGIIAVLLHFASGIMTISGLQENFDTGSLIMNMPIAAQEMILALWLIVKGFRVTEAKPCNE